MAAGTAIATRSSRPVEIEVGSAPVARPPELPPDLCVVGIARPGDPLLSAVAPRALLRNTRFADEGMTVEHVRLQTSEVIGHLPKLDGKAPSRIRDAVRLAMAAGAQSVDVVLAHLHDHQPWDLASPEFLYAVDPFLAPLVGAAIVLPDIGGPIPTGPGTAHDIEARAQRFIETVKAHGSRWAERYQLALLDDPGVGGDLGHRILTSTAGHDASLVRWVGQPEPLRQHGWRSAAAFVGGMLASRDGDVILGVQGFRAKLAPGRRVFTGRHHELTIAESSRTPLPEDQYYIDVLAGEDGWGRVLSEPVLRAPVGSWTLPAVRVAKVIHWRVMQTASRYVFESADLARAVSLGAAVTNSLSPYVQAGLLVGGDGEGEPTIRAGVVRDPAAPGLRVDITAVLRPWSHRVQLRVNLRPGGQPLFEEVA